MNHQIVIALSLLLTYAQTRTEASEREELTAQDDLRKNLVYLTVKYDTLCQEMRLISQHVVFLEQALSDITQHGSVLYRKKRETGPEREDFEPNQKLVELLRNATTGPEATVEVGQPTVAPVAQTTADDSLIIVKEDPAILLTVTESTSEATAREEGDAKETEPKCDCNLLHEYSCPIDKTKTFDYQFNDWFHNLLFSMSQNCSKGAKEFANRKHRSKHHRKNHRHHRNIRHGNGTVERSDQMSPSNMSLNPAQIDVMEQSLVEDDTVYATCDVVPNRHISLILQQNVKGKINLWQRSDGHGALHAHVQLTGFRVTAGERRRRETNLMPVEAASETSTGPAALSLEHGFHVHTTGDLSRSCQSTGTHFNPTNSNHGGPMDSTRHVGDLGNIRVDEKGSIDAEYSYPYVSLVGEHSIVGKSLVIHAQADDYGRMSTGNSGPKIACCVVESVEKLPFLGDTNSAVEPIAAAANP